MRTHPNAAATAKLVAGAVALAAAALCGTTALAGSISWAGPSMVKVAEAGVFSGREFPPNLAVTIAVRAPDGSEAHYSAVTTADGTLEYSLKPAAAGSYSVRVLSASGKQISTATFNSMP